MDSIKKHPNPSSLAYKEQKKHDKQDASKKRDEAKRAIQAPSLSSTQKGSGASSQKLGLRKPSNSAAVVPLDKTDAKRTAFSAQVAAAVNPHFNKPYAEALPSSPYYALHDKASGKTVYRPNHSLAHGLRQAYLAVDIGIAFKHIEGKSLNAAGQALAEWVKEQAKADPLLFQKIEFANAFQRTGRQSEASRDTAPEKFERYLEADKQNLQEAAAEHIGPGKLFKDQAELDLYKTAIATKFESLAQAPSKDLFYLSKLLYTSHLLDLRRLPHFDKKRILEQIALQLFETKTPNAAEKKLIDKLWQRSGDYLAATGDRDMDSKDRTDWDAALFAQQAHDPDLAVQALQLARSKPQKKLLDSIVHHAAVAGEIKHTKKAEASNLAPSELRETLKQAPYTASEGYLKILLGEDYCEIPKNASEQDVRRITKQNIEAFLSDKKKAVQATRWAPIALVERVKNPDKHYVDVLVNCMLEERKHKDKVVLYHTTEPEMALIFDIFSHLRNQLALKGSSDITALRAIDSGFIALDHYIQETQAQGRPANVLDFMAKFQGVADDHAEYRDMVLSTNFGLFGSDQQVNADTYNMFYEVKDRKVATQLLVYDKFFDFIQQKTGIPLSFDAFKPILEEFILQNADGENQRNGKLLQIFVDAQALNDTTYFSVLMGAPVLKDGETPPIDTPIRLLRTEPEKLLDYLEGTSGSTQMEGVPRHLLRPNTLKLHDLQARLYMRPEVMLDKELVQIKSYWRFDTPPKAYMQQIKELVNEGLSTWLTQGSPAEADAFAPHTQALNNLANVIHKGVTGTDAPKAPPIALGQQLVSLCLSERTEAAARLIETHYEALKSEPIVVPPDRNGKWGATYDLAGFLKRYSYPAYLKIAFDKGLFPGGQRGYEFFQKLKAERPLDVYEFLDQLQSFQNARKTLELFEKYFKDASIQDSLKLLCALNTIQNDTAVLDTARPLMTILDVFPDKILEGVAALRQVTRGKVCTEAARIIQSILAESTSRLYETTQLNLYIKDLLIFTESIQGLSTAQQDDLWSLAKAMKINWDFRFKALDILKHIDWKAVPPGEAPQWPRALSAPFTAKKVIAHAKTKPEAYEMGFLKSTAGKVVIQEIIDQINKGMLPINRATQKYPSMVSAYNKGNPEARYNMSLIAEYVSNLKSPPWPSFQPPILP